MSGSGTFVKVTEGHVALNDMAAEIQDTISYTRTYADQMRVTLNESIANLAAVVGSYTPVISQTPTVIPTIDGPSFPGRPNFSPLNLDEDWPDGNIPEPDFKDYGILDFDFVAPVAPAEIDEGFSFIQKNYTSPIWQTLFSVVHERILNGEYGLSDSVHAALVSKEQESRRINQDREFRSGLKMVGATGWNLPGGHSAAFISEFQKEVMKRDQDSLNNITVTDFNIANENMKFFVGSATDLEKMVRATFDSAENLSLEAAKAAKEYLARFFSENVKLFLGKWEGIGKKLEAMRSKVEAISSRNESETKIYLSRAQVIESKVKAITQKNQGLVDVRKGEVEVYGTEVDAVRSEYLALVEEIKVNQEAVKIDIDREIRTEELKLTAFSDRSKLAQTIGLGISNIGSQGVASALGAINTQLSNSYSGSERRGEDWSHSDSIREGHDYNEEAF